MNLSGIAIYELDADDGYLAGPPVSPPSPAMIHRTPQYYSYCDCDFPNSVIVNTSKVHISELVHCRCGEEPWHRREWSWYHSAESDALVKDEHVTFHPTYSQGTAIVRGNKPLKLGMVHHWEIRVLTALAGTDVMVGIGTNKVDLNQFKFHFTSALGSNSQSWGFSYNGKLQHNGQKYSYGDRFSQGSIIGVILDLSRGTLEFYLNRRPMGVAFTNIPLDPNIKLYPMVCSTAAKSAIRLMNCTSQEDTLQLRSFKAMSKQPKALAELRSMPGLDTLMRSYWFFSPPVRYSRISKKNQFDDMLDEAVLSSVRRNRYGRKVKYHSDYMGNFLENDEDVYSNAHKIPNMDISPLVYESDDDIVHARGSGRPSLNEYFDEHFNYLF